MATPIPAFVSQYLASSTDTAQVTGGTVQTLSPTLWYYLVSNRTDAVNGRSLLYEIKRMLDASLAGTTWTVQLSATSPFKLTLAHDNGSSREVTLGATLVTALGFASSPFTVATATTVTADYPSPLWWSPDMPVSMTGPSQFDPALQYGVPSSMGSIQRSPDGTFAAMSHGTQWTAEYVFNGVQYYYKARKQTGFTNLDFETWWSTGPRKGLRFLLWRERTNATGSNAPSGGTESPYNFIEYFPQQDLQSRLLATPTTAVNTNYHDIRIPCFPVEEGEVSAADVVVDPGPDIGPRYILWAQGTAGVGPITADLHQVEVGDVLETVAVFDEADTPFYLNDSDVGNWTSPLISDNQIDQTSSDDFQEPDRSVMWFVSRPGAWKRDYILKCFQSNGLTFPSSISVPGLRVGDTIGVDGELGNFMRIKTDANHYPLLSEPIFHDTKDKFETTVTVDDELQQVNAISPLSTTLSDEWIMFATRNADAPSSSPKDYLIRVVAGQSDDMGDHSRPFGGAQIGDTVESVISVTGGSPPTGSYFQEESDRFETVITVADHILQTIDNTELAYIIMLSRPSV